MFYSHEILSSTQYGVATIWLVATTSKGTQRHLTRKAVQEVNVPKACGTIIDPGAPLALRLQGNLLYGVSRVFSQQCNYVLMDAEKTQSNMMTFFRIMKTSDTDPQAGKAKRHQITLADDPDFDPWSSLPDLELLNPKADWTHGLSQGSVQHSQFSPANLSSQDPPTPDGIHSFFGFDLPASSKSGGSYRVPSDLDGHSSLLAKEARTVERMGEFRPFEVDDEFDPLNDIGLEFDADGNMIGLFDFEEPELPPLPASQGAQTQIPGLPRGMANEDFAAGDEGVLIMGDDVLPDADGFVTQPAMRDAQRTLTQSTETEQAAAPLRRSRVARQKSMIDPNISLRMSELKEWNQKYPKLMSEARKNPSHTTAAQAKRNAMDLLFGNGIAGVGVLQGGTIRHPLADHFSGVHLLSNLGGVPVEDLHALIPKPRSRRRKASEAVQNDGDEEGRRVRPRVEEEEEVGRTFGVEQEDQLMLGDDSIPEIGMGGQAALEDRHSSSMMPWSRAGSVAPGSAVRGHSSVRDSLQAPSPLFGSATKTARGQHGAALSLGSDDFGLLHSQDSSLNYAAAQDDVGLGQGANSQAHSSWLDTASQDFLEYATDQARKTGFSHADATSSLQWIEFERIANPNIHSKAIAAQAFLHILSLATKNVVAVQQDGREEQIPFGRIHIGLDTADGAGPE